MSSGSELLMLVVAIVYYVGVGALVVAGRSEPLETSGTVMFVIGGIITEIVVFRIVHGFKTKCKKCGNMFAYQVYDHNIVDVSDTTITEEKDIRNKRGEKIGSYTQDVAATAYTTKQYLRCKYCGHETTGYVVEKYKK